MKIERLIEDYKIVSTTVGAYGIHFILENGTEIDISSLPGHIYIGFEHGQSPKGIEVKEQFKHGLSITYPEKTLE